MITCTSLTSFLLHHLQQTVFLSDTARKLVMTNVPPQMEEIALAHNEKNGHIDRTMTRDGLSLRAITRDGNGPVQYNTKGGQSGSFEKA